MTYHFEKGDCCARFALALLCVLLVPAIWANGQRRNPSRVAPGFDDVVFAVAFSPDGRTLAIARGAGEPSQRYGRIELWDAETGELRHVIKGFDGPVRSISFSPDGQTLVSGSSEFRSSKIQEKAHSRDGLVVGELKWWDANTGELKHKLTMPGEGNSSLHATYSPDGQELAIVESFVQFSLLSSASPFESTNPSVRARPMGDSMYFTADLKLLDAQTAAVRFKANMRQSRPPSFSPDGALLALVNGNEVKIWNTQTGKEEHKLKGFKGDPSTIAFSPDGKELAVVSIDFDHGFSGRFITMIGKGEIKFFDISTWKELLRLTNLGPVTSIAFNPTGRVLLIGGMVQARDGLAPGVRLVDLQTKKAIDLPTGEEVPSGSVDSLVLSQSGQLLAFRAGPTTVQLLDTQAWKVKQTWDANSTGNTIERPLSRFVLSVKRMLAVAFSADGSTLSGESDQGEIKLWDPRTGEIKNQLANEGGDPSLVAVSTDGKSFAEVSNGKVLFWDAGSTAKRTVRLPDGRPISAVALSADGQILAIGSGKNVTLLSPTGAVAKTLDGRQGSVNRLAFSEDGRTLASADEDGVIEIWSVPNARIVETLTARTRVTALRFAPNGQTLATAGEDRAIILWNLQTGTAQHKLQKHDAPVNAVAFSPDGELLASGGDDRTVVVWEVATGKSRRTLKGHDQTVTSLAFSPDGRLLASGSGNAAVVVWEVRTGKLSRVLR